MNLEIQVGRLPGSALARDYHAGAPALAPFFFGWPWDPAAFRRKAAEVDARFDRRSREAIAAALGATSPGAARALDEFAAGQALLVTTGQQAGLFGGPLYTLYKILSAIRLAAALAPVLDRPVYPLFWVAADDHDWDEVNHLHVLDAANSLHRLELDGDAAAAPASMGVRRLGPTLETTFARLSELVPTTEFTPSAMTRLREAYRPERSVAGAFRDLIAGLFRDFDLLLVDSSDPAVKRLAAPVLAGALENAPEHEAALLLQTSRLERAGYPVQVPIAESAANVFYEDELGRERLQAEATAWTLRRTKRRLTHAAVLAELEADPARFSPNVLLRPVVESTILPTLAYVGGPAELSYYAQIGCLFKRNGLEMPLVFPRFSVTLVEAKVRKVLDKFGLDVESLRRPIQEVAGQIAREELPEEVTDRLSALRSTLDQEYGRLVEAALPIDPTLRGPLQSARNVSLRQVEEVETKIVQHLKKRNAVTIEQIEKAHGNLFPHGEPQERVLNFAQYLVRYGPELLPEIASRMEVELRDGPAGWDGVTCE